jgi:DNA polymerase III subunit epsilon
MSAITKHQASTPQLSLDDLGIPLSHVRFCVIDLETTGASPTQCAITEVAAARFEGGECIGVFSTLINPGQPIPPQITYLTGITEEMVGPAPTIDSVLPALIEFVGTDVIVGHNVRFDLGFLNAALMSRSYQPFTNKVVDTLRLARRLLRDETPNCKLGTLAEAFRLEHQPTHRALDDVRATADLLHLIFERAAGLGVMGLDDLLELPSLGRHPSAAKLKLTNTLPRRPGVYLFRDAGGAVLYVGKATNLRARVRSYFGFDDRRKVGPLLHITAKIDHFECATPIEAAVMEVRLIQHFRPRFNRQSKMWPQYAYLRIGGTAGKPAIAAVRDPVCGDKSWLIGPFPSLSSARIAAVAFKEASSTLPPARVLDRSVIDRADEFLEPLEHHMRDLGADERFEEAASLRDRAGTLARAIERQQRNDVLRSIDRIECTWNGSSIEIRRGRVTVGNPARPAPRPEEGAVPREMGDELSLVSDWLAKAGGSIRLTALDGPTGLAWPIAPVPRFSAKPVHSDRRGATRTALVTSLAS